MRKNVPRIFHTIIENHWVHKPAVFFPNPESPSELSSHGLSKAQLPPPTFLSQLFVLVYHNKQYTKKDKRPSQVFCLFTLLYFCQAKNVAGNHNFFICRN